MSSAPLIGISAVAINGHAVLIEGAPGSGKSSLALSLIDRGGVLIGDDGVMLCGEGNRVTASPPHNISEKLEIRGVGIVEMPTTSAPVALILTLTDGVPRLPDGPQMRDLMGFEIPALPFNPSAPVAALRAEWALRIHGLTF